MENIDHLKLELIARIMKTEEHDTLIGFSTALDETEAKGRPYSRDFTSAVTVIRENVTLDQIFAEQNYQPFTFKEFQQDVASIEWHDSLHELLALLD